ncbi:hypothetical protein [Streptacidiphilus albus]|uniref:hypothetical protein n=1 Tax=Streptacidiphilus albus TaxID=105425 RepID=UPI0005A80EE7|nr:hypothetical protein [Streptacidiphilus albus]
MTERRDAIANAHHWALLADDYLTAARDERAAAGALASTFRAGRRREHHLDHAYNLAGHAADARDQALMWATVAPLLGDGTCGHTIPASNSPSGREKPCIRSFGHASAYHADADGRLWRPADQTVTTAQEPQ